MYWYHQDRIFVCSWDYINSFCFCNFSPKNSKNAHTIISYNVLNRTMNLNHCALFLWLNYYSLLHFLTMKNLSRHLYFHWEILKNVVTIYIWFKQSYYQNSSYHNIQKKQILYFAFELKTNFLWLSCYCNYRTRDLLSHAAVRLHVLPIIYFNRNHLKSR